MTGFLRNPIGPLEIFLALTIYVLCHGLLNNNFNLSHYYWLSASVLLLTAKWIITTENKGINSKPVLSYLHTGIIIIASIESIVVICQWLGLFPTMNELFACTGTWVNPNVTAMFLAISLFSQKYFANSRSSKTVFFIELSVILLAIALLQCRTAYVVAAILLLDLYKEKIPFFRKPIVKISIVGLLIFLLTLGFKTTSTGGRMQIGKNSLQLIAVKPITGAGFGQFEKEYNSFVAVHSLPSADHVYMPYNDFVELAVEGGGIAVVLWLSFLGSLIWCFRNNSSLLALVVSFIIIQLTNFGIQAIPVFALFLIYTGFHSTNEKKYINRKERLPLKFTVRSILMTLIVAELFLLGKLIVIANAFHQNIIISEQYPPIQAIEKSGRLAATLNFSSSYYESRGDLFMQVGDWHSAVLQYRRAGQTTSRPGVLGKCGWSYSQSGHYDSAAYYFKVLEKLQPYKYAPRMALLKLYELKKDTAAIKLKAREIMDMPVKVPGAEVDRIKSEAGRWVIGQM